jgi:Threonine dehydrogenase and related Zn-dependent dehydrogenases
MKAVLLYGIRDARVVDLPIPKINDDEILVKMKACGICGTDIEKYSGNFVTPPILGHEVVGYIYKLGKNLGGYKEGQKVFVHHHVPCRVCYYCLRGDFTLCDNFTKVNFDPCGLAEYFRVPAEIIEKRGVFVLSEDFPDDRAIFIEPLACCIKAINKIKPSIGDKVAIFGAGPAGLLILLLLRSLGITSIACIDINNKRLDFSKNLGCEISLNPVTDDLIKEIKDWSEGRGADIAIVATSSVKAIENALNIVRKGGTICLFGNPKKNELVNLNVNDVFIKEIKIIPSYSTTELEIYQAINLLGKSTIRAETLISHRFRLDETIKALELSEKGDTIKAVIYGD